MTNRLATTSREHHQALRSHLHLLNDHRPRTRLSEGNVRRLLRLDLHMSHQYHGQKSHYRWPWRGRGWLQKRVRERGSSRAKPLSDRGLVQARQRRVRWLAKEIRAIQACQENSQLQHTLLPLLLRTVTARERHRRQKRQLRRAQVVLQAVARPRLIGGRVQLPVLNLQQR